MSTHQRLFFLFFFFFFYWWVVLFLGSLQHKQFFICPHCCTTTTTTTVYIVSRSGVVLGHTIVRIYLPIHNHKDNNCKEATIKNKEAKCRGANLIWKTAYWAPQSSTLCCAELYNDFTTTVFYHFPIISSLSSSFVHLRENALVSYSISRLLLLFAFLKIHFQSGFNSQVDHHQSTTQLTDWLTDGLTVFYSVQIVAVLFAKCFAATFFMAPTPLAPHTQLFRGLLLPLFSVLFYPFLLLL